MPIIQIVDEHRIDLSITKNISYRCITGSITNCCQEALKDACIKAITLDYKPIAHTITDCNGAFTLIIEAQEKLTLVISKSGYMTLELINFTDQVEVCLEKQSITCILSGSIIYPNAKPASPVRVQLVNSSINRCVFSRPNGRFIFTKIPSGKYTLTFSGNTCKEKSLYVTIPEGFPTYDLGYVKIETLDIMCTIHGIITDSKKKPIENVVVALFNATTGQPILHTLTNENGLYFFGGVKKGHYYIEAYD